MMRRTARRPTWGSSRGFLQPSSASYPEHIANRRPLVRWLLAIPYVWIAGLPYWLTGAWAIIAFFTVLFTKTIPRGLFELMAPGLRWTRRGNRTHTS